MGTRSITVIKDSNGDKVIEIYRQYDGYLKGHGADLAKILTNTPHNGVQCLAASVIAGLKEGLGNIYVYPPSDGETMKDHSDQYGVDYYYEVIVGSHNLSEILLTVWDRDKNEPVHTEQFTSAKEK